MTPKQTPDHAPLVLGPVIAWRAWALSGHDAMLRLRPVGRLAGNQYAHIHDLFEMKRPNENYKG